MNLSPEDITQINKHFKNENDKVSEKKGGIVLYGFILGIIMSYSGFLSYFAGVGTGIIFSRKYSDISYQITDKFTSISQNIINQVKTKYNN